MNWTLRFGFGKGVVLINASLVCLELVPNFHDKNLTAFHLVFVAAIQQHFASGVFIAHKHYSHQAFAVRIQQWRCPIFMAKIRQSFMFGEVGFHACVYGMCKHGRAKMS